MKMNAIRIHEYGEDQLRSECIEIPTPENREVQIKVIAASINPVDWKTKRGGGVAGWLEDPFPFTLGYDVSGTVSAIGPDVTEFSIGDEVYGMINFHAGGGGYAEYAVAPADQLVRKPTNLGHVEAAALPLVALTAWQALFEKADLQAGQRVLIHAAAGGVGHIAVQLAKWKGAHVIGTASEGNQDYLEALGVDTFIDYRQRSFEEALEHEPVDVVLDTMGGEIQKRSFGVIKPGGVLVSIVQNPEASAISDGVRAEFLFVSSNQDQLNKLTGLVERGQLCPTVSKQFPLSDTQKAHQESEAGHVRGKLVLTIG